MDADLALLHQKIDFLTEQMEAQRRRQQEMEELKRDLIPIANQMLKLSIDELAEIGREFELEDLLFLLKRFLRNTRTWLRLMDYLEGALGLAEEGNRLGKEMFNTAVAELDRLEREGYFAFMREAWRILERIVTEFSEEDVRALGDNIVTILTTVRNMTQPEVLALANKAIEAIRPAEDLSEPPSALELVREMADPKVRLGMARMLNLVKALAEEPALQEEHAKTPQ
jgi:uncharacterized protein YjgD (DUF1641 family)